MVWMCGMENSWPSECGLWRCVQYVLKSEEVELLCWVEIPVLWSR